MLIQPEVPNTEITLIRLGYRNKYQYAKSKLYAIVKKHVLERDNHKCRVLGCSNDADKIQYLNAGRGTLAGQPYYIFSFCDKCYEASFIVDPPRSEKLTFDKVLTMLTGFRKKADKSNPLIGFWYCDQKYDFPSNAKHHSRKGRNLVAETNRIVAEKIRAEIESSSPGDWARVKNYWKE